MSEPLVLLVADSALRQTLYPILSSPGFDVVDCGNSTEALQCLRTRHVSTVIVGLGREAVAQELDLVRSIRRLDRCIPIVLLVTSSCEELAIAALRAGVSDYLKIPFASDELLATVQHCLSDCPPPGRLSVSQPIGGQARPFPLLIGQSPRLREIVAYSLRIASVDSNVFVTGETGSGKELIAEFIHRHSPRSHRPLVCINCAAIPDTLVESELFGHERGAFTGAHAQSPGKFELANGGTAFLDEIGDLSPYAQAKLLRTLESKEIFRLGARHALAVNFRVIAATNHDVEQLVSEHKFRSDLYFRLNVARIHLPSLRERPEDIPALLDYYRRELNQRFRREVEGFTEEALDCLLRYDWPGNVRELKNLLEATYLNFPARCITVADLPAVFRQRLQQSTHLPQDERADLLSALLATNWNVSKASQKLHWSRMTLYRKIKKYRLSRNVPPTTASDKV